MSRQFPERWALLIVALLIALTASPALGSDGGTTPDARPAEAAVTTSADASADASVSAASDASIDAAARASAARASRNLPRDAGPADAVSTPGDIRPPDAAMNAPVDAGPADGGTSDAMPDATSSAVTTDAAPDAAPDAMPDAMPDAGFAQPAVVEQPTSSQRASVIIRVIIGLSILFVLAYLASHPRIRRLQEDLRIAQLTTAGFPFVLLGLIARHPSVGVLTDDVLQQITPMLNFGLGWLGFIIGMQLDVRFLDKLPRGTGFLVVAEASAPFAITVLVCGGVMIAFGMDISDPALIRDALLLGAAGAMTATLRSSGLSDERPWIDDAWSGKRGVHGLVSQLDEIWGVACLLFMVAFLRPEAIASTWTLPGTAWAFVTLGLGVALGLLMFVIVRAPRNSAEFLAVLLGFIAFAAGLAGYLRLSPIVVCFIAGVLLTNFPCDQRDSLNRILAGLERPIHLTFLIIAGALWDVGDWRGWALVPLFVISRFAGRWLGMFAGEKAFHAQGMPVPAHGAIITPLSVLAIALVVSVERLYGGDTIPWVMTAVIGGAYVTELVVQLAPARFRDPTAMSDHTGHLLAMDERSGDHPGGPAEHDGGKLQRVVRTLDTPGSRPGKDEDW